MQIEIFQETFESNTDLAKKVNVYRKKIDKLEIVVEIKAKEKIKVTDKYLYGPSKGLEG